MTRQIAVFSTVVAVAGGGVAWLAWAASRPIGFDGDVGLKSLGDFDLPPDATDAAIPPLLRNLDGRAVALEGFVYAPNSATNNRVADFQVVYDTVNGSHGPPRFSSGCSPR